VTPKAGALSKPPAWFDLAVLVISKEKKRHFLRPWEEIENRPRAAKVLKSLYQTTFTWKNKRSLDD